MLVFGDSTRSTTVGEKLATAAAMLAATGAQHSGIAAHASLVAAFIELAELGQGIADAAFEASGVDTNSLAEQEVTGALMRLAAIISRSWRSGFTLDLSPPSTTLPDLSVLARLLDRDLTIRCKSGEGYAFYALYPESYLAAGKELPPDTRLIGIRSIGLGLAAIAAAAARAPRPVSVRPFGHPFRREIALSPGLSESLLGGAWPFAIVDEGPGLSGSSFGAVADFLEDRRVFANRIHFLPGHAGDLGPHASERHRERWRNARRHSVDFESLSLEAPDPRHRLASWVKDLTGNVSAAPEDISGGRWRALRFTEGNWPPAHIQQERRKYLLHSESGAWLLKFAGLGRIGEAKHAMARMLHAAGFAPPALGLRHGFLIEAWFDAKPVLPAEVDRDTLIHHLARYLGFRSRHFPAGRQSGASLAQLAQMAHVNSVETLGAGVDAYFAQWSRELPEMERASRPIAIDGRLHWWEWLRLDDGRLIKTDATDHHRAHDLVGCQDIAWDIVGATVEFELSEAEKQELVARMTAEHAELIHAELIAFLMPCYLAFQAGYWTMADLSLRHTGEAQRLGERAAFYVEALRRLMAAAP